MQKRFLRAPAAIAAALALTAGGRRSRPRHTTPRRTCRRASRRSRARRTSRARARRIPHHRAPNKLSAPGIGQYGGAAQALATRLGTAAGKKMGKKAKLKHLVVGYLDIVGGIQSADRVDNAMRVAVSHLGATWKTATAPARRRSG